MGALCAWLSSHDSDPFLWIAGAGSPATPARPKHGLKVPSRPPHTRPPPAEDRPRQTNERPLSWSRLDVRVDRAGVPTSAIRD